MAIKQDYKRVSYKELQKHIHRNRTKEFSDVAVAGLLGMKSTQTVRNAFNTEEQVASDPLLTKLMKLLGVNGKVEWIEGVRYYSIKN